MAEMFGLGDPEPFLHFLVVRLANHVSVDFMEKEGAVAPQHYAFLVDDGETMPNEGIFLEVVPGTRFVTTDAVVRDKSGRLTASGPFMIGGWEIEPEGDGTRYTGWARHWTDEALKRHEEMGFIPGWGAVAGQLKALCEAD